ncbi:DUF4442 domain-containing protein [Wenyingzhuangia marina]|uniref:Acyl-coenzyme A thioesterase PaaI, contains HGG motif n=1 Tax=Wenyingzhuangia marina TaxID=1195760 RepID=A0A1M5WEN8_9FLAO|nr:DUF4442 domain-containing protein [Wenyingzhuangia marina]GGF81584.1 thioesterase [Wenyingzhuangia marina]SHH85693.1 protein of unknown function [Wenyingzhuangia marina]
MKLTVKQFNRFILYKLPSAYFCGVRLLDLKHDSAVAKVRFRWINQNPFKSIYFAVLAMAAELSTGTLVLKQTQESKLKFSTLVVGMNAQFLKKAVGEIRFTCADGAEIQQHIYTAMETREGVAFTLKSTGVDESGDEVARFEFSWSIKIKA